MTATIQIIVVLLGVLAAVAVAGAAPRHRTVDPPGHRRHRSGAHPGPPHDPARAGIRAPGSPAADHLLGRRFDELARIPLQPQADRAVGLRLPWCSRPARWRRAVHWLLGWPWAVSFLLGAIVAPPDVVAPLALARPLNVPRRLLVVLEGEGLANDATALILYRFAVAAIVTGTFSPFEAAGTFVLIVVGEIAYGIGVGWLSLRLRRRAADPRVEIVLSLITPYAAYWVPPVSRRVRRARDRRRRALCELAGSALHRFADPAPGHLLLGPDHLHHRGVRFPAHRIAGPHADRKRQCRVLE